MTASAALACTAPEEPTASKPDTHKPVRPVRRHQPAEPLPWPDSLAVSPGILPEGAELELTEITALPDGDGAVAVDSVALAAIEPAPALMPERGGFDDDDDERERVFNPDPSRAVWLSALLPGLGQLYNRRYWKLPIVIGGFMGLGYATSWNNGMLRDYSRAYFDLMDNDPATRSYMDFFPSTTKEDDLNKTWLQNVLKNRKDYYRRNRDLCIIGMVGVYLLAMVDAYVDASLSHFDISPDLAVDMAPAIIPDTRSHPGVGMCWALTF